MRDRHICSRRARADLQFAAGFRSTIPKPSMPRIHSCEQGSQGSSKRMQPLANYDMPALEQL
jgi:hypothetical protein